MDASAGPSRGGRGWRSAAEPRLFTSTEASELIEKIEKLFGAAKSQARRADATAARARGDVDRAESEMVQAGTLLARAKTNLEQAMAGIDAGRARPALIHAETAKAEVELRRAESVLARAHAELARAKADLARANAELTQAETELKSRVHALGGYLRSVEEGEVDFLTKRDGVEVYLCWKLGDHRVNHWHELESSVFERKPLRTGKR